MELRAYRPEDCGELIQLFRDTLYSVNAKHYTHEQLDAWAGGASAARWNVSMLANHTLVATEGKVIIGFGDMDATGTFDHLFVHQAYQGQGVATALANALEAWAVFKKLATVTTYASITARPFFEGRGYTVCKEQRVERNGQLLTNYIMQKYL